MRIWRQGLIGTVALAALTGAVWCADRLLPPDLSRLDDLSPALLAQDGTLLHLARAGDDAMRLPVRADQVDPRYRAWLLAYEDRRFYRHPGVDPLALARATWSSIRAGRVVSGGSTITMQLARLLEPRPRTVEAKLIEIARALQLETRFSKDQILGLYLTLAPFGGNLSGVRAASLAYFGHEPTALGPAEAALLVALPQSPTRRRPDRHPAVAQAAAAMVLARLAARGLVDAETVAQARLDRLPDRRLALPASAPHLARRLVGLNHPQRSATTALDARLQTAVEAMVRREARWFGDGAAMAVLVVEARTRLVRAYLGGADFFGPHGQVDLTRAVRSPGSTLKPFIYSLAFDDRALHPQTLIDDRPDDFAGYLPRNFDAAFHGTVSVRRALQSSLNLPAVAVLERLGPERLLTALTQGGARPVLDAAAPPGLAIGLGGVGLRLVDLATLYAGLADDGQGRVLRLTPGDPRPDGPVVWGPLGRYYVADILLGAPRPDGVGRAGAGDARRFAYKTGTSFGFRDAWAIGWSGAHVVAVWVGRADGTPRPGRTGRDVAAPLMVKVFDLLDDDRPLELGEPPLDALAANAHGGLPPGLRQFRRVLPSKPAAPVESGPRIAFPPAGAVIDLARDDAGFRALPLKAEGGRPPFRWYVNGEPVAAYGRRADAFWRPDGEGFARIAVVDAGERAATVDIRLR